MEAIRILRVDSLLFADIIFVYFFSLNHLVVGWRYLDLDTWQPASHLHFNIYIYL